MTIQRDVTTHNLLLNGCMVNSVAFEDMPEPLKAAQDTKSPKEETAMEIKNLEDLKTAYPDLCAQLENSARQEGQTEERERLQAIDDVARGSGDSDWQPVKDAATTIAMAEDRAILHGLDAAGIGGIVPGSSNAAVAIPDAVEDFADAVAQALSVLRTVGVDGPYSLLLSSAEYTKVSESTDHGYPIREHLSRQLGAGEIIWAPALEGALLVSTRGGDYELHLGQDLSIGYYSHDSETVELYLQDTFGFLALTDESSVPLSL